MAIKSIWMLLIYLKELTFWRLNRNIISLEENLLNNEYINKPISYMDNKGKLFVTLFDFLNAGSQVLQQPGQIYNVFCTRTHSSARNLNPAP